MKIAISSEGPDMKSSVSRRLGTGRYFLIVDLETGKLAAVENPGATAQRGAGVQALTLLLGRDVEMLMTGHCSPNMRRHLEDNGVEVVTGVAGVAEDILEQYRTGKIDTEGEKKATVRQPRMAISGEDFRVAALRSWNQVSSMLPITAGVVLLVGIFNSFVSRTFVDSIFSGSVFWDAFRGACAGSILAGNPINSYIIGGELLKQGVSLLAVTAFMLTWVTVGLVQLPAEIAALGRRFAVLRNVACFFLAILIAIATALILVVLSGGPTQ